MTTARIKDGEKNGGVNWEAGEQFLRERGIDTLFTRVSPDFDADEQASYRPKGTLHSDKPPAAGRFPAEAFAKKEVGSPEISVRLSLNFLALGEALMRLGRGENLAVKAVGCLCLIALAACATAEAPLASDKVRNAEAAIAIAQRVCGVQSVAQGDRWIAELKGRGWRVTQQGIRSWCPARAVEVSATDGSAEECRVCVGD